MKDQKDSKINEDLKKLVIARIEASLPSDIKMSIGSEGTLSKAEMIEHVQKGDSQGTHIMEMHLNFIKAITSGRLIKELNTL